MSKLNFEEIDEMLEASAQLKDNKRVYRVDMVIKKAYHVYASATSDEEAMDVARQLAFEGKVEEDWETSMEDDDITIWNVTELCPDDEEDE